MPSVAPVPPPPRPLPMLAPAALRPPLPLTTGDVRMGKWGVVDATAVDAVETSVVKGESMLARGANGSGGGSGDGARGAGEEMPASADVNVGAAWCVMARTFAPWPIKPVTNEAPTAAATGVVVKTVAAVARWGRRAGDANKVVAAKLCTTPGVPAPTAAAAAADVGVPLVVEKLLTMPWKATGWGWRCKA